MVTTVVSETDYDTARQYLLQHNVLCLATTTNDTPWVAPVFYSVCADKLVFLSSPHTLHCQNIASNPQVSASVQEDYSDWAEIKGIQLQGRVSGVNNADKQTVIDAYSEKFPVTGGDAPPEITNALEKISWFEISVEKLLFIDNSKGLGYRVELDPVQFFSI